MLKGFREGYSVELIAGIDNLCITKRILNIEKGAFISSDDFKERLD